MVESFLSSKILRKGKGKSVVLIHGLFSNNAFWIPYLDYFADCQVTLVNVDYAGLFRSGHTVDALSRCLDRMIGGHPAHLIGHSFGSCLGMCLKSDFLSRSFICPIFSSAEFRSRLFCSEVAGLTRIDIDDIVPVVDRAVDFKTRYMNDLIYRPADDLYLPHDDPYFRYVESVAGVSSHVFSGGHFNVREPVKTIRAKRLGTLAAPGSAALR